MRRNELEHLIRAAAAITDQYELVIVGSQSLLGAVPEPPASLTESMEADVYPLHCPELADLIDGAIGEGSPFHDRFGYYAQGVGPKTAVLPVGWEQRWVPIQNANTDLKVGFCLDPNDLALSKLAAGREKDWPFVAELIAHKLVNVQILLRRLETMKLPNAEKIARWLLSR
jgi:hypothetical protein